MNFNLNINNFLIANNISRYELFKNTGIPPTTICSWLNNNTKPNIYDIAKISDYFNCSIDYLIGRESEDGQIIIASDKYKKTDIEIIYEQLNEKNKIQAYFYCQGLIAGQSGNN